MYVSLDKVARVVLTFSVGWSLVFYPAWFVALMLILDTVFNWFQNILFLNCFEGWDLFCYRILKLFYLLILNVLFVLSLENLTWVMIPNGRQSFSKVNLLLQGIFFQMNFDEFLSDYCYLTDNLTDIFLLERWGFSYIFGMKIAWILESGRTGWDQIDLMGLIRAI